MRISVWECAVHWLGLIMFVYTCDQRLEMWLGTVMLCTRADQHLGMCSALVRFGDVSIHAVYTFQSAFANLQHLI